MSKHIHNFALGKKKCNICVLCVRCSGGDLGAAGERVRPSRRARGGFPRAALGHGVRRRLGQEGRGRGVQDAGIPRCRRGPQDRTLWPRYEMNPYPHEYQLALTTAVNVHSSNMTIGWSLHISAWPLKTLRKVCLRNNTQWNWWNLPLPKLIFMGRFCTYS